MGVVRAQIQTVEEIYRLIWTAVANRRPIKATIRGGFGYFARIDLAGIGKEDFAYSATSTAATVPANLNLAAHLPTGVVSHWRSSRGCSYWKAPGTQQRITHALAPVWPKPISTRRIIPNALHRKDTEEVFVATFGQG